MNVGTGRRVLKKLKYQPVSGTKLRGHHDLLLTEISLFIFFISHRGLSVVWGQEADPPTTFSLSSIPPEKRKFLALNSSLNIYKLFARRLT